MSTLRVERFVMPAADLGPENPLPPLHQLDVDDVENVEIEGMAEHERRHINYGRSRSVLPYREQDRYNRQRKPRAFVAAVLENQHLKATFLPELGGRLWSLIHKATGHELLYVNPVFQPGNLAFRNAWFSGGVEWNIGPMAHTPLTCSTLFAGIAEHDDGTPVLRLWEWERVRRVPYQIDAWLPDNATMLRVRIRIINANDHEIPMYSWSNIAVPEQVGARVIVPAEQAYTHGYVGDVISKVPYPYHQDMDQSYPTNVEPSFGHFYAIPDSQRHWISSLDTQGCGLIQTSTSRQFGRKLFGWGMTTGGRHWQEFLSVPNKPYIEIQAGITRTQMESQPMPAGAEWTWLEAYGLMQAEAPTVHGKDWTKAWTHVDQQLDRMLSKAQLEAELQQSHAMADRPVTQIVCRGTGWGALERMRRANTSERPICPPGIAFDDQSLQQDQTPWLNLLQHGSLNKRPVTDEPGGYQVAPAWRALLEQSIKHGNSDHWLGWFHLGVIRYNDPALQDEAEQAWKTSVEREPNPWAYRCLAILARDRGDYEHAASLLLKAHDMLPSLPELSAETCRSLLRLDRAREVIELIDRLPADQQDHDRILLARAAAAILLGDYQLVLDMIHTGREFATIREGERSLTDLWFEAHELRLSQELGQPITRELRIRARRECPPPLHIDFRMRVLTPEQDVEAEERSDAQRQEKRQKRLASRARKATCT